jgi:Leucine-rich repeat (LRR) protein
MRLLFAFMMLFGLAGIATAQDSTNGLSPYEIALQHIETAQIDSTIVRLDLSGIGLAELPPEIGNLTNLEMLFLHNNQLSSLPPEIGNLSNLERLGLYNNQLSSLPPEIGNLSNLINLDLSHNQLSSLPPEIANLQNLRSINLNTNQFQEFPAVLEQLDLRLRDPLDFNGYGGGIYIAENPFNSPLSNPLIRILGIFILGLFIVFVFRRFRLHRQNQKNQ